MTSFRDQLARLFSRRSTRKSRTRRPLRFESLEGRSLLAVIPVTTFDDFTSPGGGAASGTLRSAIEQANATPESDTILLPAGTYNLSLGTLVINGGNHSVTIQSQGPGPAELNAQGRSTVLKVLSDASLVGIIVSGGASDEFAGGIYNFLATLNLTSVTIAGNGGRI